MEKSIILTGTIEEICAKLACEAQGCEKMSFAEWVELRKHENNTEQVVAHLSVKRGVV